MTTPKPVVLCILDGWGLSADTTANAVALGQTPNFDRIYDNFPHTQLIASGTDVGLPAGVMGNSEVGHLNLGAGRIVWGRVLKGHLQVEMDRNGARYDEIGREIVRTRQFRLKTVNEMITEEV